MGYTRTNCKTGANVTLVEFYEYPINGEGRREQCFGLVCVTHACHGPAYHRKEFALRHMSRPWEWCRECDDIRVAQERGK